MGKQKGNRMDGKHKGNGQYGELLWNRMDEETENRIKWMGNQKGNRIYGKERKQMGSGNTKGVIGGMQR